MRNVALTLCLAIAACTPAAAPDPVNADNSVAESIVQEAVVVNEAERAIPFDPELMTVELGGDGIVIRTAGHIRPARFENATQEFVERMMADFGKPERSDGPEDCPAGKLNFLEYPNHLKLAFQDGKLAGYWADESSLGVATEGGIKPGSPRTALGNAPTKEASFGKLVTVDGAVAMLDEKETKVTDVYAGAACIYD